MKVPRAHQQGFKNVSRLKSRVKRGQLTGGRYTSKVTFKQTSLTKYLEDYLNQLEVLKYHHETINHRRIDLGNFFEWCEARDLQDPHQITLKILESYQGSVARYRKKNGQPLGHRNQYKRISAIRDYFKWLVRHGVLQANPASELMLPRREMRLPEKALCFDQIKSLMAQPKTSDLLGIRDRAMLEMLYATAMRRSELVRLELQDINEVLSTLHIRLAKGRKDRIVPVGSSAMYWCQRYLKEVRPALLISQQITALFLTGYGDAFHPNALGALITRYMRAAGIEKGGSHLLRHTCATHMLEGGADIRYIQKLLGHACLDTTAIYTEMNIEALRRVYQATHPAETTWQQRCS